VRRLEPECGFGGFDDAKLGFRKEGHTRHLSRTPCRVTVSLAPRE
jgi:hypothetical protein